MIRILATVLLFAAPAALAAEAAKAPVAVTQFDQLKGVKSWKKGGDNIVFVQSSATGDWYKAMLLETCMTFDATKGINFMTELDPVTNQKTSRVVVARHICTVDSLTKVDGPPPIATK